MRLPVGATKLLETAAYGGTMGRKTAWLPGEPTKVFACGGSGCNRFPWAGASGGARLVRRHGSECSVY